MKLQKKLILIFNAALACSSGVSGGKLDRRTEIRTHDEIGELGVSFNRMAEEIEHQVDDLKILLGALTHEIKTPMTSIIVYSDTLLHVKLPEEEKQLALGYICCEGKRLEKLSEKMLNPLGLYENDAVEMEWLAVSGLFSNVRASSCRYCF